MYRLFIGNKNYSSWSLRPWVLMRHFDLPFEEVNVPIGGRGPHEDHLGYSPSGLVPCLHDGDVRVWDSLAIAEYLAERHAGIWPADPVARAWARCICAEMHSGFGALRSALPMNIKLTLQGAPLAEAVARDLARIVAIWSESRARFSGAGPWLMGAFSAADAMFAPVVFRFHTYNTRLPDEAAAYRDAMLAHPHMQAWAQAARAETVALAQYDRLAADFGGAR